MSASSRWEHISTVEAFSAEAIKLGYKYFERCREWRHPEHDAFFLVEQLEEMVESFGAAMYPELLAAMSEASERRNGG